VSVSINPPSEEPAFLLSGDTSAKDQSQTIGSDIEQALKELTSTTIITIAPDK